MSADSVSGAVPDYSDVVGRTERRSALIEPERVEALANTLGIDNIPGQGGALPPAWHWIFFNPFVPRSAVGVDGHLKRGGFLPDVGLPRRMWAGGRLQYIAPVPIGKIAEKVSEILSVTPKSGKAGRLVFVTVKHRIVCDGTVCVEEEQDIVYRELPQAGAAPAPVQTAPEGATWSETLTPDPVLLFRYSALTFNGHRIHYDAPYAREAEGYPDLVVHGPLISTLLHGLATRARPGKRLRHFDFRAISPLFVSAPFALEAAPGDAADGLILWARGAKGELAMRAEAVFAD
ncbi:hypothetical protein PMI07_005983 [Rhizobium sp. CF080]|uniref:hypothetical protein n=1 Tax=Rhizobium sp. (strain CF080) TaxID=1144310 RepID=UPI000271A2CD|nr:hypothetical protein [Rhizobium sp. CF080]EUB99702.1 hypothetical protein PMI07_005983 [Rhizobium sp. CF080]